MANNDGKITIIIEDGGQGSKNQDTEVIDKIKAAEKKAAREKAAFNNMVLNSAKDVARKTFGNAASSVGRWTGDSVQQAQINSAMQMVNYGASIFQGALTGSAFGPVGTAIGAAVAIASIGIDIGFKQDAQNHTRKWQDLNAANQRQFSELLSDRSRY